MIVTINQPKADQIFLCMPAGDVGSQVLLMLPVTTGAQQKIDLDTLTQGDVSALNQKAVYNLHVDGQLYLRDFSLKPEVVYDGQYYDPNLDLGLLPAGVYDGTDMSAVTAKLPTSGTSRWVNMKARRYDSGAQVSLNLSPYYVVLPTIVDKEEWELKFQEEGIWRQCTYQTKWHATLLKGRNLHISRYAETHCVNALRPGWPGYNEPGKSGYEYFGKWFWHVFWDLPVGLDELIEEYRKVGPLAIYTKPSSRTYSHKKGIDSSTGDIKVDYRQEPAGRSCMTSKFVLLCSACDLGLPECNVVLHNLTAENIDRKLYTEYVRYVGYSDSAVLPHEPISKDFWERWNCCSYRRDLKGDGTTIFQDLETAALENMKDVDINIVNTLNDWKSFGEGFKSMSNALDSLLSDVKTIHRASDLAAIAKDLANTYLPVKYGERLTVSEMKDDILKLGDTRSMSAAQKLKAIYHAIISALYNASYDFPDTVRIHSYISPKIGDFKCTFAYNAWLSPSDNLFSEIYNGLQNKSLWISLSDAWDTIPYSFAVDWFLPISDWLETIDQYAEKCNLSLITKLQSVRLEGDPPLGHLVSNQVADEAPMLAAQTLHTKLYQRWLSSSFEPTSFERMGSSAISQHWLEASALIVQRL